MGESARSTPCSRPSTESWLRVRHSSCSCRYSGIGKSSVVNELHKCLPGAGFRAGKFDQYKRDIPYATLAQASRRWSVRSSSRAKRSDSGGTPFRSSRPNGS